MKTLRALAISVLFAASILILGAQQATPAAEPTPDQLKQIIAVLRQQRDANSQFAQDSQAQVLLLQAQLAAAQKELAELKAKLAALEAPPAAAKK